MTNSIKNSIKNIGIIGDGQLAKMLIQAGISYNLNFYVYPLGSKNNSICRNISTLVDSYAELFQKSDVVTYEFEDINIKEIEKYDNGTNIIPNLETLKLIQSKLSQKTRYMSSNISTSELIYMTTGIDMYTHLSKAINDNNMLLNNWVLKADRGGYNGCGVLSLTDKTSVETIKNFITPNATYFIEKKIKIKKEIAVMAVVSDKISYFEPVEMSFNESNILEYLFSPASISDELLLIVLDTVKNVCKALKSKGLFCVEMFIDEDDNVFVNEVSPRPHNSGHHTIKTGWSSQFDELIKILINRKCLPFQYKEYDAIMINILGPSFVGPYKLNQNTYDILTEMGFIIYDYGKTINKPLRKMGHMTFIPAEDAIFNKTYIKHIVDTVLALELIVPDTYEGDEEETDNYNESKPVVGIIMGSISDKPVVEPAIKILKQFDIQYDIQVVSAHRMPKKMAEYAEKSMENGLKVIIACAGGAAHLPGMVASMTTLPVIGLPAKTSTLNGVDSLYSIVQMPSGVPVATVGINNGINAALLACRILAINDLNIEIKLINYQETMCRLATDSNENINL